MLQAEKVAAYREAQNILALGQKWQRLTPGEKRPNFERSAKYILRRAVGHKMVERHTHRAMHVHNGLMHQHEPREARRIERYLRSGIVHPDVLHSFRQGARPKAAAAAQYRGEPLRPDDPDVEHIVADNSEDVHYPTHMNTRSGAFISRHADIAVPQIVSRRADPIGYKQDE